MTTLYVILPNHKDIRHYSIKKEQRNIMAKSSINIGVGEDGYFAHNSRESWSQSQVFFDEENEYLNNKENAFRLFRSELAKRSLAYTERTKQKLQKKTATHLSAIINLNKFHKMADVKKISDYLAEKFGTKILQVSLHRDEGKLVNKKTKEVLTSGEQFFCNPRNKKLYFDEDFKKKINMSEWKIEKNYHAHIEFLGLDEEGKSIKRYLTPKILSELQDFVADTLKMERGQKRERYTADQVKSIEAKLKPKSSYANKKEYSKAWVAEAKKQKCYIDRFKDKRVETHSFKKDKSIQNKIDALTKELKFEKMEKKATKQDLKDIVGKYRKKLFGGRTAHRQIEALHRELELERKSHKLTVSELIEKVSAFEIKNEVLEQNNSNLYILKNAKDATVEELELENKRLKAENQVLKAKISTLPSSDTLEKLNTLKSDFKTLKTSNTTLETKVTALELKIRTLNANIGDWKKVYFAKEAENEGLKEKLKAFEDAVAINQALPQITEKTATDILKKFRINFEKINFQALSGKDFTKMDNCMNVLRGDFEREFKPKEPIKPKLNKKVEDNPKPTPREPEPNIPTRLM